MIAQRLECSEIDIVEGVKTNGWLYKELETYASSVQMILGKS